MKKIIYLIAFAVIVTGIGGAFIILNNSSEPIPPKDKEKAITKILGRKPILSDDTQKGNTVYNGKYVSFSYPARAKVYTQLLNGKPVPVGGLDYFSFDLESPRIIFSMEVVDIPTNAQNIEDYPAVKLRELESNLYVKKELLVDDKKGLVFDKYSDNSFEKTAFIYFNGLVYSFHVEGSDSKEVESLFNKVILSASLL